ncbi:hypothetical protein IM792_16290 [Mucilaginibacter sp. JRF]|uniref:hypothetical protein n=1 Tax=Mucilaginibacter sp. JRF TaxID=2780088 RepID=UPI0018816413|nr:hypothetical protein [Mucilaginibacter sp. JRF]MBE9586013.1 hypothetical protein [Mucilaginibacter sp. JRF]
MEISYLKSFRDTPSLGDLNLKNESISVASIVNLQVLYNSGRPFPIALRELLFLAGAFCLVLDYGDAESQQELQDEAREWLRNENRSISRSFFVIEVINGGDQFLFVYLDEGEDPYVNRVSFSKSISIQWNITTGKTLSQLCDSRMERIKRGESMY